jgi:uncharacterized membrane protein YhaH (DUF805 family)
MMALVVIALLIIVIIFGISSGMQSYATAQQAQAQIELAQVAQVNAWGNLVTILTLALVIVAILAVVMLVVLRRLDASKKSRQPSARIPGRDAPQLELSTNELIQLLILEKLAGLDRPAKDVPVLDVPREEQPVDEPLHWLRRG